MLAVLYYGVDRRCVTRESAGAAGTRSDFADRNPGPLRNRAPLRGICFYKPTCAQGGSMTLNPSAPLDATLEEVVHERYAAAAADAGAGSSCGGALA